MKRPADQRRKLPPELEAFARSDDEKLRIRRPRVDQGRVRDPREGYTVAGVSNRDARAVYDVRTEAMRQLWAGGEADDEARSLLGQLFHEALRLELWHARRLTSFAALAEEVVGIPAAEAEALAEAYAEQTGEPLTTLTERATALWLRTEAGLYEGDENARARILSRGGKLMLELSVELAHVSTALAGVGARHLPLARSPREDGEGEPRHRGREQPRGREPHELRSRDRDEEQPRGREPHELRSRDEERRVGERYEERRYGAKRGGLRDETARDEPALRSVHASAQRGLDEQPERARESTYRAAFEDGADDDAAELGDAASDLIDEAGSDEADSDEADNDDAGRDEAGRDEAVDELASEVAEDEGADDDAGDGIATAGSADVHDAAPGQGLGGARLLTRKPRLDGMGARSDREPSQPGTTLGQRAAAMLGGEGPRLSAGDRGAAGRERSFGGGEPRGRGAERPRAGGLDRSAVERPRQGGAEHAERPRFGADRGNFAGNSGHARFAGKERPRFVSERAGDADRSRIGAERGNREGRSSFGAKRGGGEGARFGADRGGSREDRPRFGSDRGAGSGRFGAERGNREDRPRFAAERGAGRFGAERGNREDRPRFGGDKERNALGREDRPRFGNDRGRAPGAREERPRFGNDRGRNGERPKPGGFGDRGRGPQGKFGKGKPGDKGGKGFGARKPFGQKDKTADSKGREPRRADDDDNLE